VLDPDHAGPHHHQLARDAGDLENLVGVDDVLAIEADMGRTVGPGSGGDHEAVGGEQADASSVSTLIWLGSTKRAEPLRTSTPLRANWCSSTSTSWLRVMCRRVHRSSAVMCCLA